MCEYCSCRQDEGPIAALSADHEGITAVVEECRGLLRENDTDGARRATALLIDMLGRHDDREERSFYAEMRAVPHIAGVIERLGQEHRTTAGALRVFAGGGGDAQTVGRALDALTRHIFEEEYDLFPASLLELGFDAWARIGAALLAPAPSPAMTQA